MESNIYQGAPQSAHVTLDGYSGDGKGTIDRNETKAQLAIDKINEIGIGTIDEEYTIESENLPFSEVRANVPNTDDVDLPVNTVRM